MANKVKLGFVIAALALFLFPFEVNAKPVGPDNFLQQTSPTTTTPTSTSTPTSTPTLEPTATPTEEPKEEEGSPINIWQIATFGLVIAFLAIIIGFILGGKKEKKEEPKSKSQKKEEENEEEETEE